VLVAKQVKTVLGDNPLCIRSILIEFVAKQRDFDRSRLVLDKASNSSSFNGVVSKGVASCFPFGFAGGSLCRLMEHLVGKKLVLPLPLRSRGKRITIKN